MMKIVSWNAKGLCKPGKRRRLKKMLRENEVDYVFIQETKQAATTRYFAQSIWNGNDF